MRRLDVRMVILDGAAREAGPHVHQGVIFIPRVKGRNAQVRRWLVHELAEIATRYEGIAPLTVPSNSAKDRHLVACEVEETYMENSI